VLNGQIGIVAAAVSVASVFFLDMQHFHQIIFNFVHFYLFKKRRAALIVRTSELDRSIGHRPLLVGVCRVTRCNLSTRMPCGVVVVSAWSIPSHHHSKCMTPMNGIITTSVS
jgi:hypothetical protein